MPKRPAYLTPRASDIRRMLDRGVSRKSVMALTGATRQAVHNADKQRKPRGRPPVALPRDRVTMYVKQVTQLRLAEAASTRGQTVGEVVDTLSEQLRPPPEPWGPCKVCGAYMRLHEPAELPLELERILTAMLTQEVRDRTRADYHASAAIGARVALAHLLDRISGHCLGCGSWANLVVRGRWAGAPETGHYEPAHDTAVCDCLACDNWRRAADTHAESDRHDVTTSQLPDTTDNATTARQGHST